jgi:AraC-like DNA-binding protein
MDRRTIIKEIIENNKSNYQFTVCRLAYELGVSYSYLYEIVNQHFDMSPQQLIETVRMEEAIRMIARGKKQIKIYKRLGYGNIRSFREAFHKRLQMNYTDCRLELKKKNDSAKAKAIEQQINNLWNISED